MYYGLVLAAVGMFGVQFLLSEKYQRSAGSGAGATWLMVFGSSIAGLVALICINGFDFAFTLFTLIMAAVTALNLLLCTLCGLRALGRTNLSLYSLFSMLGGMVLPFGAGLVYGEAFTLGKLLCVLTVTGALALTVHRGQKGGYLYLLGVFVTNGISGVLSKIYQEAAFAKASAAAYSIWTCVMTAVLAGILLLCLKEKPVPTLQEIAVTAGGGILNKVANFLLLIALAYLSASIQYPLVTGGVMILSTLLGYFTLNKPGKREWGALLLSMIGIIMLVGI